MVFSHEVPVSEVVNSFASFFFKFLPKSKMTFFWDIIRITLYELPRMENNLDLILDNQLFDIITEIVVYVTLMISLMR